MTKNALTSAAGVLALMTGVVGLFAITFIILFYTVGRPFGSLNDISNGLLGILSGILAVLLYTQVRAKSRVLSLIGLILALVGAVSVPIGSALVVSGRMGWFQAGYYTSAGFGVMGLWLVGLNAARDQGNGWSQGLIVAGLVIGGIMALGLVVIPGFFTGMNGWDASPWYVKYVGASTSSLGWLVLYPIWLILLGRMLLRS
jgi:hypothetical protein